MDDDSLILLALMALGGWWWYSRSAFALAGGSASMQLPNSDRGMVIQVDLDSKVEQMAEAIATAEGFYTPGTVPNRFHNPGDLGPEDTGYPAVFTDGSNVSQLPDDNTGWTLLRNKLRRIFLGQSKVYSTTMTIEMMARKWAGNWQAWSNNVARELGISTQTTIEQWLAM